MNPRYLISGTGLNADQQWELVKDDGGPTIEVRRIEDPPSMTACLPRDWLEPIPEPAIPAEPHDDFAVLLEYPDGNWTIAHRRDDWAGDAATACWYLIGSPGANTWPDLLHRPGTKATRLTPEDQPLPPAKDDPR